MLRGRNQKPIIPPKYLSNIFCLTCNRGEWKKYNIMPEHWRESDMEMLRKWKSQCFVHMWLQSGSCYLYRLIYNVLSFPIIILSTVTSGALFASNTFEGKNIKYVAASGSLVSAVLAALIRQLEPVEKAEHYSMTTSRYHNIIRDLDSCLAMREDLRDPAKTFIDRVRTEMNAISTMELTPSIFVVAAFRRRFGDVETALYGEDILEIVLRDIQARNTLHTFESQSLARGQSSRALSTSVAQQTTRYRVVSFQQQLSRHMRDVGESSYRPTSAAAVATESTTNIISHPNQPLEG